MVRGPVVWSNCNDLLRRGQKVQTERIRRDRAWVGGLRGAVAGCDVDAPTGSALGGGRGGMRVFPADEQLPIHFLAHAEEINSPASTDSNVHRDV